MTSLLYLKLLNILTKSNDVYYLIVFDKYFAGFN